MVFVEYVKVVVSFRVLRMSEMDFKVGGSVLIVRGK